MNAYTYLIGWTEHKKFYYGSQYGKKANPENLWVGYHTSSKHVAEFRKIHGEPDVVEVRKVFGEDGESCRKWEERVLMKIHNGGVWLNKRVANSKWFHQPGRGKGIPKSPEHRAKIGAASKGYMPAKNINTGEFVRIRTSEYYANPDMVAVCAGRILTDQQKKNLAEKNTGKSLDAETREKISKSLMGRNIGIPLTEETKKKISEKLKGRVMAKNIVTGDIRSVSREDFNSNDNLRGVTHGVGKSHTEASKEKISAGQRGLFTAYDIDTASYRKVSREEFDSNPNLKGPRYKPR